jgi:biopolymer transport protein ExbD
MDVGNRKGGPAAAINVTPLVDIVLVLLIIFMVLTPSMLKHLTAAVPEDSEEEQPQPQQPSNTIIVSLTVERELKINNEAVTLESLVPKLQKRLEGRHNRTVFFQAEDEVPYGDVVRLMDLARGSGAETLAVVTKH